MAVYLTPASVAARLSDQITEARRLLGIEVRNTSEFQFHAMYTRQELNAFNVEKGPSVFLIAKDDTAFEALIPPHQNGVLNYMRLKNAKALDKVQAVLAQNAQ